MTPEQLADRVARAMAARAPCVIVIKPTASGKGATVTQWLHQSGCAAGSPPTHADARCTCRPLPLSEVFDVDNTTRVLALAHTIAQHWRDQDGFNTQLVDELERITRVEPQ